MTGYVSGFVHSVATVTMIMAAVSVITPKNAAGRAAMLCGSILLTVVLLSPIKGFDTSALSEYDKKIEVEIDGRAESILQKGEELKEDIIEENLRAYILQRTKQFGIYCDAEVLCLEGMPDSVRVKLKREEDKEKVSQILTEECGIAKEKQMFEVSE